MKEKLFSNLALKLLAVLLGFVVWVVVLNIDDSAVTKQIKDIPVEILNEESITDRDQLYSITSGETVDIIVKGRKSVVNALSQTDFIATADLSKISITNAVPIEVSASDETIGNAVTITIVESVMQVELEKEKTVAVPVVVVTNGQTAPGYTAGTGVATPNLISVKGAESVVNSIDRVELSVDVNGRSSDISMKCTPIFYTANGEVVSEKHISCDVRSIAVTVPIYKTKEIPVNIKVRGTPADDYVVSSVEYVPETIVIGGEGDILENIKGIDIDDIDISGYNTNYETTLDISKYLPEGIVVAEENAAINVKVTIEKTAKKSLDISVTDINIKNKTDNYYYDIVFENGQTVTVSGAADVVADMTAADLNISVDGQNLVLGENHVELTIADGDKYTVDTICNVIITVSAMP
ncbi:MAG: YbbR-like domain-containing protein [Coprococcus sp.]